MVGSVFLQQIVEKENGLIEYLQTYVLIDLVEMTDNLAFLQQL
jgi:hypothetical protein